MTAAQPQAERERHTLVTLEIGRFVAALAVALYHYTAVIENAIGTLVMGDIFRAGHVGVPYFFVLSGFIIYYIHRPDIGRPDRWRRFAMKRGIRLYPMFWIVTGGMLLIFLFAPSLEDGRNLSFPAIVPDLLLLPHHNAILPISWTLRHEIIFYVLFSFAIWFGYRAFWAIAIWTIASAILSFITPEYQNFAGLGSLVRSPLNLGFGIGMIVAQAIGRPVNIPPMLIIIVALTGLIELAGLEWRLGAGVPHAVNILGNAGDVAYLFMAGLLVYGLVTWENSRRRPIHAPIWKTLGGASYILYLVHPPVGSAVIRILQKLHVTSPNLIYFIMIMAAILCALLLHLMVEKPILRMLSDRMMTRPSSQSRPA